MNNQPAGELGSVATQEEAQVFGHLLLSFAIRHHDHNVVWQFIICKNDYFM